MHNRLITLEGHLGILISLIASAIFISLNLAAVSMFILTFMSIVIGFTILYTLGTEYKETK